ncbi:uncharacterized protein METZ01_LOCUS458676 [marine metagenome]|uniref:Uncharacterized protein n=1 Tax=marine metagenome TaxID=408172 RepID=A0A383ADM9_9ZZZZ
MIGFQRYTKNMKVADTDLSKCYIVFNLDYFFQISDLH